MLALVTQMIAEAEGLDGALYAAITLSLLAVLFVGVLVIWLRRRAVVGKIAGASPVSSQTLVQSALDSLSAHVAILDEKGIILAVNEAWRDWARRAGMGLAGNHVEAGRDYLDACQSGAAACGEQGRAIAQGIRDVLAGRRENFYIEYETTIDPKQRVWFQARVSRFKDGDATRVTVAHENITEIKEADQEIVRLNSHLRHRLDELQTILSVIPIGIAITEDAEARRIRVNPYYAKMLEIAPDANASLIAEDAPTHFKLMRDGRELSVEELPLRRSARQGVELRDVEMDLVHNDGRVIKLLATVVPLLDECGKPRGSLGAFLDITERKRVEHDLLAAKQIAEDANRAKDSFLAMLSHELRMPLTPVLAAVTAMLGEQGLPPELTTTLEMVRRNVDLQVKLIDDLLDITRISRGKMRLKFQPADIHALVAQTIEICRPDVEESVLELSHELAAEQHHVRCDPARMQQVLWNVIKNAVKYTPAGGKISVRTYNVPSDGQAPNSRPHVVIEIVDTGIGIDSTMLTKIFDPFVQAEAGQLGFLGLGLGLAISRSIITAHGGRMLASSAGKGKGATFQIELETVEPTVIRVSPVLAPTTDAAPASPESSPAVAIHRILLVEDHEDTLYTLSRLLAKTGFDVRTAKSIAEAETIASDFDVELLITDVGLPDGSGRDLLRTLRARSSGIKAIAVSGFGMEDDVQSSIDVGFAEHLAKPVDFTRLEEAIARLATR